MTLATILSLFIAVSVPGPSGGDWLPIDGQSSPNQTTQSQTPQSEASQNQTGGGGSGNAGTGASPQAPAASPGQVQPQGTTTRQRKPARYKKKATTSAPAGCPPVNSAGSTASGDGNNAGAAGNAAASNQSQSNSSPSNSPPNSTAPSSNSAPSNDTGAKSAPSQAAPSNNASPANCPPAKTVVREGGTTEPSIQLIGGIKGAEQGAQQRSTTDQLVESTEDNLKKVAGRQLSASQQEMVNQIQQFIQQSKAAVAAGDMGRGHNLAQKAHLLSDELIKP